MDWIAGWQMPPNISAWTLVAALVAWVAAAWVYIDSGRRMINIARLKAAVIFCAVLALPGAVLLNWPTLRASAATRQNDKMWVLVGLAGGVAAGVLAVIYAQRHRNRESEEMVEAGYGMGPERPGGFDPSGTPTAPGGIGSPAIGGPAGPMPGGEMPHPLMAMGRAEAADTVILRPKPKRLAFLAVVGGPDAGRHWMLGFENRIGRGADLPCDIIVQDAAASSGQHALIRYDEDADRYLLADLASRNGTFVNGDQILRHQLQDRDRIVIGETEIAFLEVAMNPQAGPRALAGTASKKAQKAG